MARSLASKPNVIAPAGSYPFGRIKDNSGSNDGTPVNEVVYGDFHQFFAKLLSLSGVAANGLPENNSDGFQYITALQSVINSYITVLKGGVPAAGDTLAKLYTLITAVGRPRGGWSASSNTVPGSASNEDGDFWRITVAGTLSGLASGAGVVKPGDLLIAIGDGATAQGSFFAIQSNVDIASESALGLVKLYQGLDLGIFVDGAPTQKAVFDAIADILDGCVITGSVEAQAGLREQTSGAYIKRKLIDINDWNMSTTTNVNVPHGLGANWKKIRRISAMIRSDSDADIRELCSITNSSGVMNGGSSQITSTNVVLFRATGGFFDTPAGGFTYSSTSYNRGFMLIEYEV